MIGVADLTNNGVKLDVRSWVKNEDFAAARYALRQSIKDALDTNRIRVPFAQVQNHGFAHDVNRYDA